jgi:hypothetical protein
VRPAQVPVAPDSVIHQYRGENFTTSTWTDTAPSGPQADMSINGVSATTLNGDRAASSDGVDDFGLADGPQDLAEQESFGIAAVFRSNDNTDNSHLVGVSGGDLQFQVSDSDFLDSSNGELRLFLRDDNQNVLAAETASKVFDGTARLAVINKLSNSFSSGGIEIYIGDMSSSVTLGATEDQGFDHMSYSTVHDLAFFGQNDGGSVLFEKALDLPFIEFNESPYSQQDRLDLLRRAPGVPFDDTPLDVVHQYDASNFDAETQTWSDSA